MHTSLLAASISAPLLALALATQDGDRGQTWKAVLSRLDTDLDGRISAAEFPRGEAAFRRLDRDRDGFLTEAEYTRAPRRDAPPAAPVNAAPAREPTTDELAFFESKIRPVLVTKCFDCHSASAKKLKAGLRVDSRDALLSGGTSGPALVPGKPDESLLVRALRYTDDDLKMPPKESLSADVVKDFEKWVASGAPWPASKNSTASPAGSNASAAPAPKHEIDFVKAREFWAFRAPVASTPAATKNTTWAWSDVDRFLLAAMETKGVAPVADASKRAWLRRVTFDLTGLPPTPEELAAFDADRSARAFETVVDRLLASSAYGERWGRHWLDVARYAESSGKDTNVLYPHAWRYRDWVIGAFNADLAFDEFVRAQVAGDLLPAENADEQASNAIATGYLALGPKSHNARDRRQFALDVVDEQIDTLSQGLLGLTVSCARCHDHKFDPIPTTDYYALAGIFLSTETRYGTQRGPGNNFPAELVKLPDAAHVPNGPVMEPSTRTVLERLRDRFAREAEAGAKNPRTGEDGEKKKPDGVDLVRAKNAREQAALLGDLLARFDAQGRALPENRLAMGVSEARPRDIAVLDRGELDKPGAIVPRGFPHVLADASTPKIGAGSGRKELAEWIASESNPLTARVWVNRVWLHLFGAGLVTTPDNFGASGQRPTLPELLDHLALRFVEHGWSTKALVRELVLTHAYRLASSDDPQSSAIDPEVVTHWRMPERRLEAEAIRDAMLSAAGTLQRTPPVGSPVGVLEGRLQRDEVLAQVTRERPVRSVYLPIIRDHLPDALAVFDAPDAAFVAGDREETNVATQALYLMNDADVLQLADAFADRLRALGGSEEERIVSAFELALGRTPTQGERVAVRAFLADFEQRLAKDARDTRPAQKKGRGDDKRDDKRGERDATPARDPERAAWSAFAQTLFQSAEFRYLE